MRGSLTHAHKNSRIHALAAAWRCVLRHRARSFQCKAPTGHRERALPRGVYHACQPDIAAVAHTRVHTRHHCRPAAPAAGAKQAADNRKRTRRVRVIPASSGILLETYKKCARTTLQGGPSAHWTMVLLMPDACRLWKLLLMFIIQSVRSHAVGQCAGAWAVVGAEQHQAGRHRQHSSARQKGGAHGIPPAESRSEYVPVYLSAPQHRVSPTQSSTCS